MNDTDNILQDLHDIQGLDIPVSWISGSSFFAFFMLLVLILLILWWFRRDLSQLHWQADARLQLRQLQTKSGDLSSHEMVEQLSTLLHRIAMARLGREQCAGLWGERWLQWLDDNDPHGFEWKKRGRLLLDIPYQKDPAPIEHKTVLLLLNATRAWIKS